MYVQREEERKGGLASLLNWKCLHVLPWLLWLSGWSAGLQTERLLVRFLVRAHAWVGGRSPFGGTREATSQCFFHTLMFLSLSFFLPFSLKINKILKRVFMWNLFYVQKVHEADIYILKKNNKIISCLPPRLNRIFTISPMWPPPAPLHFLPPPLGITTIPIFGIIIPCCIYFNFIYLY